MAQVEADKRAAAAAEGDAVPAEQCSRSDAGEQHSDEILLAATSAPADHAEKCLLMRMLQHVSILFPKGISCGPAKLSLA